MRIKKGDTVQIIKGKNRGKTGKVMNVYPKNDRISVDGVNLYKKHVRPKRQGEKGETIMLVRPINVSNAMLVCGSCKSRTRVGYRFEKSADGSGNRKERFCKKCGAVIG